MDKGRAGCLKGLTDTQENCAARKVLARGLPGAVCPVVYGFAPPVPARREGLTGPHPTAKGLNPGPGYTQTAAAAANRCLPSPPQYEAPQPRPPV